MSYELEGRLLEVCNCNVLCPCWVGEDPDQESCDSINAWHVDKGAINDVDVSGLTIATLNHIPGNVLKGNWRVVFYVDDRATQEQQEALVDAFSGKLGGPIANLAQLYGEIAGIERANIAFNVEGGKGTLKMGNFAEAEMAPFQGATGESTKLYDTAFTTIPRSAAFVSKASKYKVKNATLGFDIDMQNNNAIQGTFRFQS